MGDIHVTTGLRMRLGLKVLLQIIPTQTVDANQLLSPVLFSMGMPVQPHPSVGKRDEEILQVKQWSYMHFQCAQHGRLAWLSSRS